MDSDSEECPGCFNEDVFRHNGIRSLIMDWDKNVEEIEKELYIKYRIFDAYGLILIKDQNNG